MHNELLFVRPAARPLVVVPVVAVVVLLGVWHLPYAFIDEYGEGDPCWDGVVAMLWAQTGKLPAEAGVFVEERFRSSPLSVYVIERLLRDKVVSNLDVPRVMNIPGLAVGLLIAPVVFLLLRRLTSTWEALIAVVLLLMSPEFFRLRCYGQPTLPALLLFLLALLAFRRAMEPGRLGHAWAGLAGGLVLSAVLMKVDVVLLGPALLAVSLVGPAEGRRRRFVVMALVFPIAGMLAWHVFCAQFAPEAPKSIQTFENWSAKWKLVPAGLVNRQNLLTMVMAPGIGTAAAFVTALLVCAARKSWRLAALGALACMVPTVLFWGMRAQNSSRHNFWLVIPAVALVGLVLHRGVRNARLKTALVAVLCLCNYFVGPTKGDHRQAPSLFHHSAKAQKQRIDRTHAMYAFALAQPVKNNRLLFYRPADLGWLVASIVTLYDRCNLQVSGPGDTYWQITAATEGRNTKTAYITLLLRSNISQTTWRQIHRDGWTVIMARRNDPPFLRILSNGARVPWP